MSVSMEWTELCIHTGKNAGLSAVSTGKHVGLNAVSHTGKLAGLSDVWN